MNIAHLNSPPLAIHESSALHLEVQTGFLVWRKLVSGKNRSEEERHDLNGSELDRDNRGLCLTLADFLREFRKFNFL
jgi:hypothetical protein